MTIRKKLAVTKRLRKMKKQVRKISLRRQTQFCDLAIQPES